MGDDQAKPGGNGKLAGIIAQATLDKSKTLNNQTSRPSLSGTVGGNANEVVASEISRLDVRIEMMENKGQLLKDQIVKEVTDKLLGKNSDFNKKLTKL